MPSKYERVGDDHGVGVEEAAGGTQLPLSPSLRLQPQQHALAQGPRTPSASPDPEEEDDGVSTTLVSHVSYTHSGVRALSGKGDLSHSLSADGIRGRLEGLQQDTGGASGVDLRAHGIQPVPLHPQSTHALKPTPAATGTGTPALTHSTGAHSPTRARPLTLRQRAAAHSGDVATSTSPSLCYRHPNGNLLSASLTPASAGHGPAQASLHSLRDPRLSDPSFLPCPVGGAPNPACRYRRELSGVDSEPSLRWWSFITFSWVSPLIATGFQRDISAHDLWLLPEEHMAHTYTPALFQQWHSESLRNCSSRRLGWALIRTFRGQLLRIWLMKLFVIALTLSRPVVLAMLLRGITAGQSPWVSFAWVLLLTVVTLSQAYFTHHQWWRGVAVAMVSRGSVIGLVYDKALKMHSAERARFTSGKIANLANVDCDNVRDFMWGAQVELWASPVVILLTCVGLFLLLGFSALVGVALLVASLFLTSRLCERMSRLQDAIMSQGDARISLVVELVQSMKLIKLYAWESLFVRQVTDVRAKQVRSILAQSCVGAANRCLGLSTPLLVSLATFSCFILSNGWGSHLSHTLDASTAFTSLLLFNTLKEPLGKLPECMSAWVRLQISLARVEEFLVCREKEGYVECLDQPELERHEEVEKEEEVERTTGPQSNGTVNGASVAPPSSKQPLPSRPLALSIHNATFDWGARAAAPAPASSGSGEGADPEVRAAEREHEAEAETEGPAGTARLGVVVPVRSPSPSFGHTGASAMHVISDLPDNACDEEDEILELQEAMEENELAAAAGIGAAIHSATPHQQQQQQQRQEIELTLRVNAATASAEADQLALSSTPPPAVARPLSACSLPSLSMHVPAGQLWMIVGAVGSGKSSLLSAILGDMQLVSNGHGDEDPASADGDVSSSAAAAGALVAVRRLRRLAYTSQLPWLESASIRDNILFGRPLDPLLYRQALHVSALEPDLLRLAAGEHTIVGENGLNLSGGQKARLSLARAVYANADLYLFDEPLSAVDAHVAKFLWDKCLGPSGCLRDRTRILVTHQLQFASPAVDRIIVMRAGRIVAQGSYAEVQGQGVDLATILQQTHNLNAHGEEASGVGGGGGKGEQEQKQNEIDGADAHPLANTAPSNAVSTVPLPVNGASPVPASPAPVSDVCRRVSPSDANAVLPSISESTAVAPADIGPNLVDAANTDESDGDSATAAAPAVVAPVQTRDEDLQLGRMSKQVYLDYFLAGASWVGYAAVAAVVVLSQAAALSSDYFLAHWSTTVTHAVVEAQEANAARGIVEPQGVGHASALLSLVPSSIGAKAATVFSVGSEAASAVNSTLSYEKFLPHGQGYYISIYAGLVILSALLLLLRSVYVALTTVRSASTLHTRLFRGIVQAPQHFFEATPSGRILNRFAKDMEQVDMILPGCVQDILACGVIVCGTLVLIVFVAPLSLPGLLLIGVLYYRVQQFYHPTSRQLKRLESVTRSPIYQHMGETAAGITTIRAYEYQGSLQRCMSTVYNRVDTNTRIMYYSFAVHRWLGIRLESIGGAIVLLAASLALYLSSSLGVGLVGLCISTTLGLANNLNWTVRQVSEMENQLNAVERIVEYAKVEREETIHDEEEQGEGGPGTTPKSDRGEDAEEVDDDDDMLRFAADNVALFGRHGIFGQPSSSSSSSAAGSSIATKSKPKRKQTKASGKQAYSSLDESGLVLELDESHDPELGITASPSPSPHASARRGVPPPSWPQAGSIRFESLSIAYRPDPAFPNVLTDVTAEVKPGEKIGIVTLALALFRLISLRAGRILIDGVDISSIRLRSLRRALSVIPQDPLLFHASIRTNLDPYNRTAEERLWEVLGQVQLAEVVRALPGGLEFVVSDAGENFSLGQRQLICLARALVRGSKIVLMDEATAALDFETDQLMRGVVQRHFAHATVLTIAHRLNTILDADRIMVFDAGKLVEFDTPKALLSSPAGYLSWLVAETNSAGQLHQRSATAESVPH